MEWIRGMDGQNVLINPADSIEILHKTGVDPYVFVRFLHMMAKALIPIWFLSWAVLLPINSVGMNTGRTGLDQLTSGNITQDQTNRYWAHLILDYIFICELSQAAIAMDRALMNSLDHVPHVGRNATLAGGSTKVFNRFRAFKAAASQHRAG